MKIHYILIVLATIFWQPVHAEQKISQGNYELHFNTFPASFLDQKTASTYQIPRSKNRGIVSVTLMDMSQSPPQATEGTVTIEAKNLFGQIKTIDIKTIKEQNEGVYYLGLFKMNNEETIKFKISAKAKQSDQNIQHEFSREFFTD